MKCSMILVLIASASARVTNENDCEGIVINGIIYSREILLDDVHIPRHLAIDYDANVLYFSYDNHAIFTLAYLNLTTNEFGTIKGVSGDYATAVDENTHSVYFGGSDGIYKLDPDSKRAINLNVTTKHISHLFYKDGLYFTTDPERKAYVYKNNTVSTVAELENTTAFTIAVDNAHNIIFSPTSYPYGAMSIYTKSNETITHVTNIEMISVTKDINGNLFFSDEKFLYSIDGKTKTVKTLGRFAWILGMVIESDGSIIFGSFYKIIRLKPTGRHCAVRPDEFEIIY